METQSVPITARSLNQKWQSRSKTPSKLSSKSSKISLYGNQTDRQTKNIWKSLHPYNSQIQIKLNKRKNNSSDKLLRLIQRHEQQYKEKQRELIASNQISGKIHGVQFPLIKRNFTNFRIPLINLKESVHLTKSEQSVKSNPNLKISQRISSPTSYKENQKPFSNFRSKMGMKEIQEIENSYSQLSNCDSLNEIKSDNLSKNQKDNIKIQKAHDNKLNFINQIEYFGNNKRPNTRSSSISVEKQNYKRRQKISQYDLKTKFNFNDLINYKTTTGEWSNSGKNFQSKIQEDCRIKKLYDLKEFNKQMRSELSTAGMLIK